MIRQTPDFNKEIINIKKFSEKLTEDVKKNVVRITLGDYDAASGFLCKIIINTCAYCLVGPVASNANDDKRHTINNYACELFPESFVFDNLASSIHASTDGNSREIFCNERMPEGTRRGKWGKNSSFS